jgi:prenyltransferase beta subunit
VLGLALLLTLLPLDISAQDDARAEAVASSVGWLLDQQADDGGFPGISRESDPGTTADAILALVAARSLGIDAELEPALDYLAENALVYAQTDPGSAAKLSLALSTAGLDPHDFNTVDPLSIVQAAASNGLIGFGPYEHALGILALAAAGEAISDETIAVARDTQGEDGGWAFDGTVEPGAADTNTTALMVQGLVAAGLSDDEAVAGGVQYLLAAQDADGGFPYQPGGDVDANSTALSVQALIASGIADQAAIDNGIAALIAFQNENGSFSWLLDPRDENLFSTLQAVPALAGLALPYTSDAVTDATPAATPVAATPDAVPVAALLVA